MRALKLPINADKTRCLQCPKEAFEFLGYRLGWNYRPWDGSAYIGSRPSQASVQAICRKVSELTHRRSGRMETQKMVARLNRRLIGWSNYFKLGQVGAAYSAVDQHTAKRLRQWLCRKHQLKSMNYVRFNDDKLWSDYGLVQLYVKTRDLPWAKA